MASQPQEMSKFVVDAEKAICIRLVKSEKDLDDESLDFHPEFCHQFFGENETIFGYAGLRINIFYAASDAQAYFGFSFKEKVDPKMFDGLEADDLKKTIGKELPNGFTTNLDAFRDVLSRQHLFKPFGELLQVYFSENAGQEKREFHICKIDKYQQNFIDFYQRMETLSLWYIDAASYIDVEDPKWHYYVTYEKYLDESRRTCYNFVGYSCVYNYYAYPEHIKPRIGQLLILPPFQKSGHGGHLMQAINNDLIPNPKVLEICAEDPADSFVRLRDYVDCLNCMRLDSFSPENLKLGFTKDLVKDAQQKLKMGKRRSRRVYEILKLKSTNTANVDEYKSYRLEVKKRLFAPFKKNQKDWKNLNQALSAKEFLMTAANMTTDETHHMLQTSFEETVEDYRRILNRLAIKQDLPEVKFAKSSSTTVNGSVKAEKNGKEHKLENGTGDMAVKEIACVKEKAIGDAETS